MSREFRAHDYQKTSMEFAEKNPYCGLILDMGMGKTISTLTVIEQLLYDSFDADKILVIAPLRVAEDTWSRETDKWQHTKHLRISKVLGPKDKREKALTEKADIYIINRENIPWLVEHLGKDWDFDTVVIDELSSFKSHSSQRFKALRRVRPLMKRVIGLTGTLAPNGYMDLWSQIFLLDRGERLGKTITEYRQRYFTSIQKGSFTDWVIRPGAAEEIQAKIKDICISMKARDYLPMTDAVYLDHPVRMSASEAKKYKAMADDFIIQIAQEEITALSAAALSSKLQQLANGAVYYDDGKAVEFHKRKLDALEEIIESAGEESVLVAYWFKHDLARIQKRIKGARTLSSSTDIADWNAGRIKVLAIHPASAGHGLNLQDGGHIIVWFGLTWNLELYQQLNARLDRQGQEKVVTIYRIITEGTEDQRILTALDKKDRVQESLKESIKALVKQYKSVEETHGNGKS